MVAAHASADQEREPVRASTRTGSMRSEAAQAPSPGDPARRRDRIALLALVLVCTASRLLTTIHYVEDLDSLHFALAMVDFDVARLQPHFPGYVVFVALARTLTVLTGSFAVGFSLVGAIATVLVVLGLLRLARWRLASREGLIVALLVVGNGMIWVYGNRYMPDLLGVALALWSLHDLTSDDDRTRVRGAFIAALLAGARLSYMPLLLPAAIAALTWRHARLRAALAFGVGIALWALPLVAVTGWDELVAIAANQTAGHFDEFGGTIRTEPNVARRLGRMLEGAWTDALSGYWPARHWITVVAGGGALIAVLWSLLLHARHALRMRHWQIVAAGVACYLVWIFAYQNVIYHTRHLLPLSPLLLLLVARGLASLRVDRRVDAAVVTVVVLATVGVGVGLGVGHRRPSALAQAAAALRERAGAHGDSVTVVTTSLVGHYLTRTGVPARVVAIDEPGARDRSEELRREPGPIYSIGDYRTGIPLMGRAVARFHHNPYVNRIWPTIEMYEYRRWAP